MRLPLLFLVCISFSLSAQQLPESLKKTLFEAEKKYGITFTFNDGLISEYLSLEEPLPETFQDFQKLLEKEYQLQGEITDRSVILSNTRVFNATICGYVKSDLLDQVLENTVVILGNRYTVSDDFGFFSFENTNADFNKISFKKL